MNVRFSMEIATVALACAMAGGVAAAPVCSAKSGAYTVALVELYTSEGCDSCPPADRWLRALPSTGITPDKAVALSLHVDYWDYIGWKDPYAKPQFTERQRKPAPSTSPRSSIRRRSCWAAAIFAVGPAA